MQRVYRGYTQGIQRVYIGYAEGIHRVYTGYTEGTHRVYREYTQGIHRVCRGYTNGIHRVCRGYTQGVHRTYPNAQPLTCGSDAMIGRVEGGVGTPTRALTPSSTPVSWRRSREKVLASRAEDTPMLRHPRWEWDDRERKCLGVGGECHMRGGREREKMHN